MAAASFTTLNLRPETLGPLTALWTAGDEGPQSVLSGLFYQLSALSPLFLFLPLFFMPGHT